MLTEEQIKEEIVKLEGLLEKYQLQLQVMAKTSSTITITGICDSMNIANAWIDALEFVLEEKTKSFGHSLVI